MYITRNAVHNLCMVLIDEALKDSGNAWNLSKRLGLNHCTLINLKKKPDGILNARHVFALIRYIGTERAVKIIDSVEPCSVEEYLAEKKQRAEKMKMKITKVSA